ncbi:MAG: phenylalanine--tRNA ligase subunit beta [Candidatus Thorarchaeota archaeon]|nr:MAG: phenylalanine--tRNA ligase subunit beta [Candidatus Thorarchaeota archaeon]
MMIVECELDDLLVMIGKKMSIEELEETLFLIKAEIERIEGNIIEIDIKPDRPDMLSPEGIARAIRSFLSIELGLKAYKVRKSGHEVIVKPGLSKIRKYIVGGIVRGITTSDELIKDYMHLQEALTSTHGRNRKKASIGLYVHDEIKYPVVYRPMKPESIRFAPLGHEIEMDGPTILREHEKGVIYGPIIAHQKKWPMLVDSRGEVLSLPPVINSNTLGQVSTETRDIFVEVTGTHLPTISQALNIMVASLAQRGGTIESVIVRYPDGTVDETPNLAPWKTTLTKAEIAELTGLDLKDKEIIDSLEKMGYGARISKSGKVAVSVPSYRADILHGVDIIEDVAIGYGFNNIEPSIPQTMTTGKLLPITRIMEKSRDLMVGIGYQEIMSYIMTSPDTLNPRMNRDNPTVVTSNPKSRDYSVLRNSLLPNLMDLISRNQHADYPQKIFEVGYVVVPDEESETRSRQVPTLCGLVTDNNVNLTHLMTEIGFALRNLGLEGKFNFVQRIDSSFIEGRCGTIEIGGESLGYFGEIAPEVLVNFGLIKPVVAFELDLPLSGEW